MITRSGCTAIGLLLFTSPALTGSTLQAPPAMTPMGHTFFCLRYPDECRPAEAGAQHPREAAAQLQQLQVVQAEVNAAIVSVDDDSGPADRNWLLWPKSGDCDDYAVTKRHELIAKGWPSSDVRLTEVSLISTGKHHLVVLVNGADGPWVLDSRERQVKRFTELRDAYVWLRVEDAGNPKFWNSAYGTLPLD